MELARESVFTLVEVPFGAPEVFMCEKFGAPVIAGSVFRVRLADGTFTR